jgi:hypothetical protein
MRHESHLSFETWWLQYTLYTFNTQKLCGVSCDSLTKDGFGFAMNGISRSVVVTKGVHLRQDQQTHHLLRLDGDFIHTAYKHTIQHKYFYQCFIF